MNKVVHSPDKQKFLFLNPPAPVPVIRDYYCSKTSRSNYLFPPIDFVMQSGLLYQYYDLFFIDAVRDKLSEEKAIAAIEEINPHIIFFLAGAVNYPADINFISKLDISGRILIASGDLFLSEPQRWLEKFSFIDAIVLDFTNNDTLYYIKGTYHLIRNMVYRTDTDIIVESRKGNAQNTIDLPVPIHELFINRSYRFPFSRHHKFSVVLTDFGCLYKCRFCVMASLPYRFRTKNTILEEFNYLYQLGVREFFWLNQTFGIKKEQALEILEEMEAFVPHFSWTAFCRPDIVDETLISGMKNAGCHTIIFGVESGSEDILKKYRKGYTSEQVKSAFALCRKYKIKTVGTFILGLPGETEHTIRKTISLSRDLGCDFASFHVAVPRAGTELRKESIKTGLINREDFSMDQSGSDINFVPDSLSQNDLLRLKRKAVLGFYLRPRYLLKRLLSIKSFYQGLNMAYQAVFLIIHNVRQKPLKEKGETFTVK